MIHQLPTTTVSHSVPSWETILDSHFAKLQLVDPIKSTGWVTRSAGLVIESRGPTVSIGDLCYLIGRDGDKNPLEVIGFNEGTVLSMPLGRMPAVRAGDTVLASGTRAEVNVGHSLLGRVVDALGRPLDELGPINTDCSYPLH